MSKKVLLAFLLNRIKMIATRDALGGGRVRVGWSAPCNLSTGAARPLPFFYYAR